MSTLKWRSKKSERIYFIIHGPKVRFEKIDFLTSKNKKRVPMVLQIADDNFAILSIFYQMHYGILISDQYWLLVSLLKAGLAKNINMDMIIKIPLMLGFLNWFFYYVVDRINSITYVKIRKKRMPKWSPHNFKVWSILGPFRDKIASKSNWFQTEVVFL